MTGPHTRPLTFIRKKERRFRRQKNQRYPALVYGNIDKSRCLFKPEKLPYTLRRGLRVLLIKDRQRPAFAVTGDQHGVADFEA